MSELSELQKRLDAVARALEPVFWEVLKEIEEGEEDE
jgi:hypothetical protein